MLTTNFAQNEPKRTRVDDPPDKEALKAPQTLLTQSRLGSRPSRLLITHVNKVELDDELASLNDYIVTDLAHAVMLTHAGIFDADHGRQIVNALVELRSGDTLKLLACDPEVGTLGLQIERYLESVLGPQGRDIQRARSRIDQKATNWRLLNRKSLTAVIEELIILGGAILASAERYKGALMPGYTHLQHSQPTTIDHYLNAHYWAISRSLDRLLGAYDRLNLCPLGGAAYSGTMWPINRSETATYLGFSGPVLNARDAGFASLDMGAELASVLAATLSAVSRLASDLNYLSSSEVGLVRIDVSLCGTSSMMPQKRNPMVLERIRGLAGVAVGWSACQLGVMHTATSTDVDQSYVHNLLPSQCEETVGAIALLSEVMTTIEFDLPAMRSSAGKHWSTASALADALVASSGLSFRDAHEAVARLVAAHEVAGLRDGEFCEDLVELEAFKAFSVSDMRNILDPDTFVATRTSSGGTAEVSRNALATAAVADLDKKKQGFAHRTSHVAQGLEGLLKDAETIISSIERTTPP